MARDLRAKACIDPQLESRRAEVVGCVQQPCLLTETWDATYKSFNLWDLFRYLALDHRQALFDCCLMSPA